MEAIFFLIFAFGALGVGYYLEGGHFDALWGPTAFIIVVGGTIGATGISIRGANLKNFLKLLIITFKGRKNNAKKIYEYFLEITQRARKDGLLSLESEASNQAIDPFIREGVSLIADGTPPEKIREVMEIQIEQMTRRHKGNIAMFEAAGGYGPTMGIVGTVMGLIHVLGNLEGNSDIGGAIAVAFLATLYGIATANLFFLPVANKLKALHAVELNEKYMIIDGLTSIANGENQTLVAAKLLAYGDSKKDRQPDR